jgi:hypothetical protein
VIDVATGRLQNGVTVVTQGEGIVGIGPRVSRHRVELVLRHPKACDVYFRIVRKPQAVNAIGGFKLSASDHGRLIVARDHSSIDRTLYLSAFDRDPNLLDNRLALTCGFMYRGVRFPRRPFI